MSPACSGSVCFETVSHTQQRLTSTPDPPASSSQAARIADVGHHAWLFPHLSGAVLAHSILATKLPRNLEQVKLLPPLLVSCSLSPPPPPRFFQD